MSDQLETPTDHSMVIDRLGPKKREAIRAATEAGFFARPQRATASDVADSLDISRSTFLYHLRRAEQEVFKTLLASSADC